MPSGRFSQSTGPIAQSADLVIEQVKRVWPDEPIRIRLQPQVYLPTPRSKRTGMYMAWRGLYWNWTCATVDDARSLREVLTEVCRLIVDVGTDEVLRRLAVDTGIDLVVESAPSSTDETNAHTNTV